MVDDRKAMFVRKALKSVSRLDSNLRAVFARAVHHYHRRRSFCQPPRHVGQVGPLQLAHRNGPLGQSAGQLWNLRRSRVDEVAEQRTQHANQRNNADQAPKDEA